jgi:FkbM family methyltransferase
MDHVTRTAFVLAAVADAPMIVNRLDYSGGNHGVGVGAALLETGWHEQGEIDLLSDLALARLRERGPGVVYVDCGANIGTHVVTLAKRMRGWGHCLGFEAQERIFYALAGNVAINNCFNAQVVFAAVADRDGQIRVPRLNHQLPANFGGLCLVAGPVAQKAAEGIGQPVSFTEEKMDTVRCLKIDSGGLQRLDILKLDVAGMEPMALSGARDTIERCKPVILAEQSICGNIAIRNALGPDYELMPMGMSVLCIHKDDKLRGNIKLIDPAARAAEGEQHVRPANDS